MFNRYELKYVLRWREYQELLSRIKGLTRVDGHTSTGKYKINSLYYDSNDLNFYWQKIDGYDNRLKVRLRWYDTQAENRSVFVEIKEKDNQTIKKRRFKMTFDHALQLIDRKFSVEDVHRHYGKAGTDIAAELLTLSSIHHLQPKVVVSYYRQPLVGLYDPRLRITFDTLLRYYDGRLLFQSERTEKFIIHPEFVVLEIKVAETMPPWLQDIILNLQPHLQRVSKYCLAIDKLIGAQTFVA